MFKTFTVSALVLIADQTTKLVTKALMELGQSVMVLGDFIRLTHVQNDGLAFSIKVPNIAIITAIHFLASLVVIYYLYIQRHENFLTKLPLAIILGGAIGNLIDRLLFGKVVDFIDIGFGSFRWPVFNVADTAVTIGLILFLIISWKTQKESPSGEIA